ncbi:MAG: hypothetical protein ABJB03_10880 [Rhodoglobus sp.]
MAAPAPKSVRRLIVYPLVALLCSLPVMIGWLGTTADKSEALWSRVVIAAVAAFAGLAIAIWLNARSSQQAHGFAVLREGDPGGYLITVVGGDAFYGAVYRIEREFGSAPLPPLGPYFFVGATDAGLELFIGSDRPDLILTIPWSFLQAIDCSFGVVGRGSAVWDAWRVQVKLDYFNESVLLAFAAHTTQVPDAPATAPSEKLTREIAAELDRRRSVAQSV